MPADPLETPPPLAPGSRRYAVFLSYRHQDNIEKDRQWAETIQRWIARYPIPPSLIGTTDNAHKTPIPESLSPVFRDEEALSAHWDIKNAIQYGLDNSDFMVVLCSPRSAASEWVRDEVHKFKEMGKSERILAVIIAGEPDAGKPENARLGVGADEECFPHELRFGVPIPGEINAAGHPVIDWDKPAEPLAADFRPRNTRAEGFTNAAAYKEYLTLNSGFDKGQIADKVEDYVERIQQARLKIIAGILGIPANLLRDKDADYQKEEAEKETSRLRKHNRTLKIAVFIVLALGAIAGWFAYRAAVEKQNADIQKNSAVIEKNNAITERNNANKQKERAEDALRRGGEVTRVHAHQYWRSGNWTSAIRSFLQAIEFRPDDADAATFLWHALGSAGGDRFDLPDRAIVLPNGYERSSFHPKESLAILSVDGKKQDLWRYEPKQEKLQSLDIDVTHVNAIWSPDGEVLMFTAVDGSYLAYRLKDNQLARISPRESKVPNFTIFKFAPPHRVFKIDQGSFTEWDLEQEKAIGNSYAGKGSAKALAIQPALQLAVLNETPDPKNPVPHESQKTKLFRMDDPENSISFPFMANKAAFSTDGHLLCLQDENKQIRAYRMDSFPPPRKELAWHPATRRFDPSPDGSFLLIELENQHYEILPLNPAISPLHFPEWFSRHFYITGFTNRPGEIRAMFNSTSPQASIPVVYYKLPSSQCAFKEIVDDHYQQSAAWTAGQSRLVLLTDNQKVFSFRWPSLQPDERPAIAPNDLEYTDLQEQITRYEQSNHARHPIVVDDSQHLAFDSKDGRWKLQFLPGDYSPSNRDSLAAVPVIQIHPPGDIRRFIEPFLDWHLKPNDVLELIALRGQLRGELQDKSKNPELPQEWRDLLLWWTTPPGERKPLYQ